MAASKRPMLNGLVNRIRLVGIELEGGWDAPVVGETIQRDGSVKFPTSTVQPMAELRSPITSASLSSISATIALRAQLGLSGPVNNQPSTISQPLAIGQIAEWVTRCYPKYVNESCGLHVHMSFYSKINYSRLMCPEFTSWIVTRVKRWATDEKLPKHHPQWDRVLRRNHPHAAHLYLGEGQVKMTRKDYESRGKPHSRYTFVNYCDGQHHTVEVRGLSMPDTAEQAIRGIMAVVEGTNEFLSKIRQKDVIVRARTIKKPEVESTFRAYTRAA